MGLENYFKLINCISKNECERANTKHCDRCIRNSSPIIDNFVFKGYQIFNGYVNSTICDKCGGNPKNGGSGICNCTLNLPQIK
jgi:hypothetical protein